MIGSTGLLMLVRGQRVDALGLALVNHGGLMTADEVILRLRAQAEQPISLLARWIVDREILSFRHCGETLIPSFQFDAARPALKSDIAAINRELLEFLDEWEAAAWFMEPNPWLHDAMPIEALDRSPNDICAAARAARFALRG